MMLSLQVACASDDRNHFIYFFISLLLFPKVKIETCFEFHYKMFYFFTFFYSYKTNIIWFHLVSVAFMFGDIFLCVVLWQYSCTFVVCNFLLVIFSIPMAKQQAYFSDHRQYDKWILMYHRIKYRKNCSNYFFFHSYAFGFFFWCLLCAIFCVDGIHYDFLNR